MKVIEYRALYEEGQSEIISVVARSIDGGFVKALKTARKGKPRSFGNLHSLEFWAVRS